VPEATIEDVQKILSGSDDAIRKVRLRPEYESAFDRANSNNPPLN
jgi:type IV secretion system protein VirD4